VHFIPYTKYEAKSLQGQEDILNDFANSVNVIKSLGLVKTKSFRDFEGTRWNSGFSLRRIYRVGYSAFLPILSCQYKKEDKGLSLKINIKFNIYVNIALGIYYTYLILLFRIDTISLIMLIAPYLLIVYLFNTEVKLLNKKLNEIISDLTKITL
jgi:hypothetical protein